jgi:hypothetical protein
MNDLITPARAVQVTKVARHKTAMSRGFLSRPVQQLLGDDLLTSGLTFFDYGCGKGGDVRLLRELGFDASGWDPAHAPNAKKIVADVVNIGYVVNVIEDPNERAVTLADAWSLAKEVLVVSARLEWELSGSAGKPYRDGFITNSGSFQKFYSQDELRSWIDRTIDQRCVAAAPGIFYVFRSEGPEQRLLARHTRGTTSRQGIAELIYRRNQVLLDELADLVSATRKIPSASDLQDGERILEVFGSVRAAFSIVRRVTDAAKWADIDLGSRRTSEALFEAHLSTLQPLIDYLGDRGRLPHADELPENEEILQVFGSVRRAFSLIRRVTGSERWQEFEDRSKRDFLVYLALAAFNGRPRFSELPSDLQYDARDLFGNYRSAIALSDKLLFAAGNQEAIDLACRGATVGKLTPEARYIHIGDLKRVSPLLRVYAGCAEALSGRVEEATLLKLHRLKPQVSFLAYPRFDKDPHPVLAASIVCRLREQHVDYRDFTGRENPPVLHRKETFVSEEYPGREKFARLSRQEERAGLLNSATIGTYEGWKDTLEESGWQLRGHRLVKAQQRHVNLIRLSDRIGKRLRTEG